MSYYSRLATAIAEHEYCDCRETPPRGCLVQRMRDLERQIELLLGPFGQDYLSYPEEMIPSYSFEELKYVSPADLAQLNEAEWALEHTKMQIILQEKQDRLSRISDLKRRRNNLTYYIALTNTVKTEKYGNWKRIDFVQLLKKMLTESHIPYEILEENGQFFVFPKGVPELDAALVSATLDWLSAYPKTQSAWIKALKEYANQNDDNASDIADKFRKTLETFFREFFAVEKSLIHCKSMYGEYLKQRGVPSQIAGNFETVLQKYDTFMNGYAKHQDKTSINVLEYLMYQTGNIIRLLITLKQGEATPAD